MYYYGARYYNAHISSWLSVDPIALYDPIDEVEHYLDGQHNGGYYNPRNTSVYGYTYQNPIIYVDPNGKQNWSKVVDWVKQKTEEVKQKTIKKVENLKQTYNKTLGTTDGRNQILNKTREKAKQAQEFGFKTVVVGGAVTLTGAIVPPLAPLTTPGGSAAMTFGAATNTVGSFLEAGVDALQAWNNDDFQDGNAFTSAATLVIGEGFDLMSRKLGGAMAEEGLSPIKEQLIKKLIPSAAGQLGDEIIKKESGYKAPETNYVEKP